MIQQSQMLQVWNSYLQNWAIFAVNVGEYSIVILLRSEMIRTFPGMTNWDAHAARNSMIQVQAYNMPQRNREFANVCRIKLGPAMDR